MQHRCMNCTITITIATCNITTFTVQYHCIDLKHITKSTLPVHCIHCILSLHPLNNMTISTIQRRCTHYTIYNMSPIVSVGIALYIYIYIYISLSFYPRPGPPADTGPALLPRPPPPRTCRHLRGTAGGGWLRYFVWFKRVVWRRLDTQLAALAQCRRN